MAAVALGQFVRFYAGGIDRAKWQNFFIGQTVDGYDYRGFTATSILINRSADEGGITLQMAARKDAVDLMNQAIADGWLVETKVYELVETATGWTTAGAVVVAQFFGEVVGIQTDLATMTVELGLGLDAITGQIPGRKMTSSLVGRLPTL